MGNYLILNDVNSNTITGLLIQNLPPISKPRQRVSIEEIDGRDGDIITPLGYGAYDKEFQIGLSYNYNVDEIIKYFDSEGKVTFSNEPDKYYNYKIIEQIDFEKLIRFKTANVKMHVQPFKYANNEEPITDEFDPITAEGKSMSLNNTVPNTFNEFSIHGNSEQESTTGKNLCPNNLINGTTSGITYTKNNNGSIKITGTATARVEPDLYNNSNEPIKFETGTYKNTSSRVIVLYGSGNYYSINPNSTRTFENDTNITRIYFRVENEESNLNETFYPQIIVNGQGETYEPYTNGASPNPSYPQEIHSTGDSGSVNEKVQNKNFININNWVKGRINNSTGEIEYANNTTAMTISNNSITFTVSQAWNSGIASDFMPITSGSYYFKYSHDKKVTVYADTYNSQKERISRIMSYTEDSSPTTRILTISDSSIRYIRIHFEVAAVDTYVVSDMQLEQGTTATDYVAHEEQNISIPCQQPMRAIGEYKDTFVKVEGNWYERHYIGEVVLDGTENWTRSGTNTSNQYRFNSSAIADTVKKPASGSEIVDILCSHFIKESADQTYSKNNGIAIHPNGNIFIFHDSFKEYTTEQFKTWLSNNNVEVIYVLATPVDLPCTEEQTQVLESKKHSYDGQTHISSLDATPAHMRVAVNGDTSVTVTNEGNIYSKPVFTISGSGDISMYLNNSQVFEISLGDEEYITIDIDKMEAYKGSVLKNRLVKGNYENCVLETGDNTISFTGAVTGIEISNYSRWI